MWKSLFSNRKRGRKSSPSQRLHLLALEDRIVPSNLWVTNTDDAGDGSLRDAIEEANNNPGADVIRFARSAHGTIELTSELEITDHLTIRGPGAGKLTVSGEDTTRGFRVDSDPDQPFSVPVDEDGEPILIDVEIRNLTIANGLATDAPGFPPTDPDGNPLFPGFGFGGGLFNRGNNVKLVGVRMTGNHAGDGSTVALAAGGAIANEFGGTLTIHHSTFDNNTSRGIFLSVGGAITQDIGPTPSGEGTRAPTAVVTHTVFHGNTSEALVSDPDAAGPFAPFAGWGIAGAFANIAGSLTASHNSLIGNEARGGVGNIGEAAVLSDGSGGAGIGGAIFSDDFSPFDTVGLPGRDAVINLRANNFIANGAYGGDGSETGSGGSGTGAAIGIGLSYDESLGFDADSGTVRTSLFHENVAEGGDGGPDGGTGGDGVGGGIAVLSAAELEVKQSSFTSNDARGGSGTGGESGGTGLGGAIGLDLLPLSAPIPGFPPPEALLPAVEVHDSYFAYNDATGGTGGDDGGVGGNGLGGAIGVTSGSTADISHSTLLWNRATGGRGGADGGDGGNGQGGGVFNSAGSTTTMTKSVVVGNRAIAGSGQSGGSDGLGQGGGLFNDDTGELTVDPFTLFFTRFNHATDDGDNVFGDITIS